MSIQEDRIAKGQCPACGKEAAPYRLCHDCRTLGRLTRALKRGERLGVFENTSGGRATKNSLWWKGPKVDDPEANSQLRKWSTPVILPESDGRTRPRLRGMRVDVEATLSKIIEFIGRPCAIEEITVAWGRLRSKRTEPLPTDLGRIIQAADKRKRKALKRAALDARQQIAAE